MPGIEVENISKTFRIRVRPAEGALGHVLSLIAGRGDTRELRVLDDISFSSRPGEVLGIIGRNGSGKSTLLRVIAGMYHADSGVVHAPGRVVYLSGFNVGLQSRLTMRENIYLVGSIMGLKRKEVARYFDDIIEFSGLKDFLDTHIYQFSSGMTARLGFSSVISFMRHKKPDVVLLDEVLGAGGDAEFKREALAKMEEFMESGASVVMVSHDMSPIRKYCSRAILLEDGKIGAEGTPAEVIARYGDLIPDATPPLLF